MRGINLLITLLIMQFAPAAAAQQASAAPQSAETVRITLTDKTLVRSRPDNKADILATLKKGATVEVADYNSKTMFYEIKHQGRMGYISAAKVPENPALRKMVKRAFDRSKREEEEKLVEMRKVRVAEKESGENAAKLQFFTIRFGAKVAKAIMKGDVWEGMTKEMVILAKGKPMAITRRIFSNIIKEQWEYERGLYLFFENELLKSHGGPPWTAEPPI